MIRHSVPLGLLLIPLLAAGKAVADPPLAGKLVGTDRLLVIAHRGNSSQAPENTLPSFRSALKSGADLIELDYYHSADGVPIVFHDKTLDRTTDAVKRWGQKKAKISSFTSQQLRELDAGLWFGRQFRGTRIPTLRESLRTIQNGGTTLIEHKGGDAKTVLRMLSDLRFNDRVVLQSFDWKFLADAHQQNPKLVIAALGSKELTPNRLREIKKTGARVVAWNHKDLSAASVQAIHSNGWKAWCYTVNKDKEARRVIEFGIDGIITDRPREMIQRFSGR